LAQKLDGAQHQLTAKDGGQQGKRGTSVAIGEVQFFFFHNSTMPPTHISSTYLTSPEIQKVYLATRQAEIEDHCANYCIQNTSLFNFITNDEGLDLFR
jgi:hypothetical protein